MGRKIIAAGHSGPDERGLVVLQDPLQLGSVSRKALLPRTNSKCCSRPGDKPRLSFQPAQCFWKTENNLVGQLQWHNHGTDLVCLGILARQLHVIRLRPLPAVLQHLALHAAREILGRSVFPRCRSGRLQRAHTRPDQQNFFADMSFGRRRSLARARNFFRRRRRLR